MYLPFLTRAEQQKFAPFMLIHLKFVTRISPVSCTKFNTSFSSFWFVAYQTCFLCNQHSAQQFLEM
jgi:hypothetical protein